MLAECHVIPLLGAFFGGVVVAVIAVGVWALGPDAGSEPPISSCDGCGLAESLKRRAEDDR